MTRTEPRWITDAMLLAMHARQIERYGGAHGVIDENVVRSALAHPQRRFAYDPSVDLASLAATYLVGFARSQGFRDGNKRTALATALVFLALNETPFLAPPADVYALTMAAALGQADDVVVAAAFRGWS